jgi:enoyl-CoA hydratase/carnithine racemase
VRLVADLDFETIKFEQRDKTACITFNRPHALNSINVQMMKELAVAYQHVEDSKEIWTLIVTGEGRAFCTGADVSMIDNTHIDGKPTGIDLWGEPILNNLRQWETPQEATPPYMTMTKPIICALNGMAAGAGLDLSPARTSSSPRTTARSSTLTSRSAWFRAAKWCAWPGSCR